MELPSHDQYLLYINIAILSVSLIIALLYFLKPKSRPNLPPGKTGWPIFGETLDFKLYGKRGHPEGFTKDRMLAYSKDVFHTSLFGENIAVFCGAQGNKFLFSGENKYVTSWWPSSIKKVVQFPEHQSPNNSTTAPSKKRRTFLLEFIKPEALQSYIPLMDSMARQQLEAEWSSPYNNDGEVKAFDSARNYSFTLASKIFMNIEDPKLVMKLAESFAPVNAGLMSVPINFPGTAFNRAVKGGKKIRAELMAIVSQRKKEIVMSGKDNTARTDFLSRMLLFEDENGVGMKETEIVNSIVGLLIAGHDTTSTSITFVLNYLAEFPDVYDRVLKEQMEIAEAKDPNKGLTWEDIQKMKYSWMVVCESLRLSPPGHGAFREATSDFTYAGYTIPKGWKTYWTVHSTHKNSEYFPDPERFDPCRFSGKGPAPFTFVPFGGGPRMCPGKEFARLEILVFMHNAVTKFRWSKAIPDEKITYNPSPTLVNGLPIHVTPHINN